MDVGDLMATVPSLNLTHAPAYGSVGYYETPHTPPSDLGPAPACCDSIDCFERLQSHTPPARPPLACPPPLSSTRLHPVGPPDETPPTTPRPHDLNVLRLKLELEELKSRVAELERKLYSVSDELTRCDCSMCLFGLE